LLFSPGKRNGLLVSCFGLADPVKIVVSFFTGERKSQQKETIEKKEKD
jgi:hypothetical protein